MGPSRGTTARREIGVTPRAKWANPTPPREAAVRRGDAEARPEVPRPGHHPGDSQSLPPVSRAGAWRGGGRAARPRGHSSRTYPVLGWGWGWGWEKPRLRGSRVFVLPQGPRREAVRGPPPPHLGPTDPRRRGPAAGRSLPAQPLPPRRSPGSR